MNSHQPRKRFGQNFLHNPAIIHHIVQSIAPQEDEHIVEIGPGLGALTQPIAPLVRQLDLIEIDRNLVPILQGQWMNIPHVSIHQADALAFDYRALHKKQPLRVIGNLPYNISTPLLFHLISQLDVIKDMHFMLQKEVVDRITAKPGSGSYGRLSVMIQYFCEVTSLFTVPPGAFNPPPKVMSAIVRLIPHREIKHPAINYSCFEDIVRTAFGQRRKTIGKTLSKFLSKESFQMIAIDPSLRPEQLSLENFVKIANHIASR